MAAAVALSIRIAQQPEHHAALLQIGQDTERVDACVRLKPTPWHTVSLPGRRPCLVAQAATSPALPL